MNTLGSEGLLIDLYQLTMGQAYLAEGMNDTAVFEFFVRKLPLHRNFLVAAGLEQALEFLESFSFSPEELVWLSTAGRFSDVLLDYLRQVRFTGDVHAMPEGTIFFANEPILRVTAPLIEAQLVETRLINLLNFQTTIASKAIRCVLAAKGRPLTDFGLRRAHGAEAGLLSARASYLAGFASTSNVLAGRLFEIPLSGTMAHSFIQAADSETLAFEAFARANPSNVTLLLDTYDTAEAASSLRVLSIKLRKAGIAIHAVRLDSGDLGEHARTVRSILDASGLEKVKIVVSGGLDECAIQKLVSRNAPIDGFGVGTRMNTSADQPYLNCAYKLQEYAGSPRRKKSQGKETWPGRKQIFRQFDKHGKMLADTVSLEDEPVIGAPLVREFMRKGKRTGIAESLSKARENMARNVEALPPNLSLIEPSVKTYPIQISNAIYALAAKSDRQKSGRNQ